MLQTINPDTKVFGFFFYLCNPSRDDIFNQSKQDYEEIAIVRYAGNVYHNSMHGN